MTVTLQTPSNLPLAASHPQGISNGIRDELNGFACSPSQAEDWLGYQKQHQTQHGILQRASAFIFQHKPLHIYQHSPSMPFFLSFFLPF